MKVRGYGGMHAVITTMGFTAEKTTVKVFIISAGVKNRTLIQGTCIQRLKCL